MTRAAAVNHYFLLLKHVSDVKSTQSEAPSCSLPRPAIQRMASLSKPVSPAFAPHAEYVKLIFRENSGVNVKLRWLSEAVKMFNLDRKLAEVKMSAVTSRFVYISKSRQDIVDGVIDGEVLSLKLDVQESVDRPHKFPTYLITRFPVDIDPSLAKELS